MLWRLQSGTELVINYGIMIFLISLAMVVVVFSISAPTASIPSSCSIYGGLQCGEIAYGANALGGSTLVMTATFAVPGAINVSSFNAVVGGMKSTGGYCTTNGVATGNTMISEGRSILCVAYFPSNSASLKYSGSFNLSTNYCVSSIASSCPKSNSYVFSGTWSAQGGPTITSSYISVIANDISTTSTTLRTTSTTSILPTHVVVTLTNNQGTSTGSNFQQRISFNPTQSLTYTANESPDLGNIRFYQSTNELYSWCESGCNSTTSTSANFWVLLPSGIAANSVVKVNMTFLPTSTEYDDVYAGKSPQLTSTYGQYDNGGSVFPILYQGFEGGACPGGWTCNGGTTYTNGITPTYATDHVYLHISGQMLEGYSSYSNLPSSSGNFPISFGYNWTDPVCSGPPFFICTTPTDSQFGWSDNSVCGAGNYACPFIVGFTTTPSFSYTTTPTYNSLGEVTNANDILTVYYNTTSGDISYQINYGNVYNIVPNSGFEIPSGSLFGVSAASPPGSTLALSWVRERTYPPNGVMPSTSYGSMLP